MYSENSTHNGLHMLVSVTVQQHAVSTGALDVLHDYLRQCQNDPSVCQYALLCVGCLVDSGTVSVFCHK